MLNQTGAVKNFTQPCPMFPAYNSNPTAANILASVTRPGLQLPAGAPPPPALNPNLARALQPRALALRQHVRICLTDTQKQRGFRKACPCWTGFRASGRTPRVSLRMAADAAPPPPLAKRGFKWALPRGFDSIAETETCEDSFKAHTLEAEYSCAGTGADPRVQLPYEPEGALPPDGTNG